MPMVVALLVNSRSILSYEIADSGLQLNVIPYCYKKCKCSEIYKKKQQLSFNNIYKNVAAA
jgi:hypothetical protein